MKNAFRNTTRILAFLLFTAICAHTCELCSYEVTPENVKSYESSDKLKDTTKAFEILDKYINWFFSSREDMAIQFSQELKDYPHFLEAANRFVLESGMMREMKIKEEGWPDSIVDKVWLNQSGMDTLKKNIVLAFRNDLYSPTILKFLKNLQGIRFADSLFARRHALSLLAASLDICSKGNDAPAFPDSIHWNDDEIDNLLKIADKLDSIRIKSSLEKDNSANNNTENNVSKSESLKNSLDPYKSRSCSEEDWFSAITLLDTLYTNLLENSVNTATEVQRNFSETTPITWHANGCGCSQQKELSSDGYLIYPYWHTKEGGDTIDFSTLNRIAYYGLTVSDDGKLETPSGLSAIDFFDRDGQSEFINVAHRHNVKVDWIIKKSEWGPLVEDGQKMQDFFVNLIDQIGQLVNKKNNSMLERFAATLSSNDKDASNRGDGVILWFQNFPTDPSSIMLFNLHFEGIHAVQKLSNKSAFANLLMHESDFTEEQGIYSYEFYNTLIHEVRAYGEIRNNFLMVISDELPLNNNIRKQEIYDDDAPMLWIDYKKWNQIEEDVSHEHQGSITDFFCPHRFEFRLLNIIVCFLAFVLLLCYFISRAIRTKLDKHFILFIGAVVALPALTTTILAIFDPAATRLLFLPLAVVVISAVAASLRKVLLKAC